MDYSQLPNDPDHPAGESPWNTSPRPTRTSFRTSQPSDGEPTTPFPEARHAGQGPPRAGTEGEDAPAQQDQRLSQAPTENGVSGVLGRSVQGPGSGDAADVHGRYAPAAPQDAPQAAAGAPGRQPSSVRQGPAQPPTPRTPGHYKLQAKITGLERQGRKDPILRFDVYVRRATECHPVLRLLTLSLD